MDLTKFQINPTRIDPTTFASGFTQSEIGTWDDCAEKWYLGYNHQLVHKGAWAMYFVYGDAFHRGLDGFYRDGTEELARLQLPPDAVLTSEQEFEVEKWQRILDVQLKRYYAYYQDDLEAMNVIVNETVVEVEFEGLKLTGKLDLGFTVDGGPLILMDHKSASRFDASTTDGWYYRFQFMYYWWLYEKAFADRPDKFMVNGMKKPALKFGVKDNIDSFAARVEQDMIQRPEEYFKRIALPYIAGSMEHFEDRVLRPKINRIHLLTEAGIPDIVVESLVRNQNTNNCVKYGKSCQFMPICQHGWDKEKFQYTRRENKHEELDAAE